VLDALAQYIPESSTEAENILERVSPCLSHCNSGVVLSCIKITMKYIDYLSTPELMRSYSKKLAGPLITLLGGEPEIQYVVLKNINIIL
jgi:vesicle coat complex subunit